MAASKQKHSKRNAAEVRREDALPGGGTSRAASAPAGDGTTRLRALVVIVVLLCAGAWAYSTSFQGVLVLDDIRAIARNPTLASFSSALQPPGASTVAGRPVANLSFALNYALAPADVRNVFVAANPDAAHETEAAWRNLWGYHLVNLLIHLAAGVVLFGVARRTFSHVQSLAPAAWWLAFAVALLWLVHPLHTEAVTYVVQRVESLMGLFYLLTLYCAIRAGGGPHARAWAAAAIAACAAGMATKEVMVTAPVLVAAWDWLFLRSGRLRDRVPLYLGLAATWVILVFLVLDEHRGPSVQVADGMVWRYLATQAGVITHYLRLAVFPAPLVFLYTWPIQPSLASVAPHALWIGLLILLTGAGLVRRQPLAFAGAWFLLILAPTSSVLPIVTEVAAEHRMYLPLAAVIGAACALAFLAARPLASRAGVRALLAAGVVVTVGLAVTLGAMTRERNRDYWSDEGLWRDTVEKDPDNQRARVAYGMALFGRRQFPEAERQFETALQIDPRDPVASGRLGAVLAAQGRLEEALVRLQRAADLTAHRDVQVLMILAAAQAEAGRFGQAAATAGEALQVARAQGQARLAGELARRTAMYEAMARPR